MNEQLGPFDPAFSSSSESEEQNLEEEAEKNERWSIKDFKGFIHFHSWAGSSCGRDSLERIKEVASKKTGLEYVGFAEHVGWPGEEYWYEKIREEFSSIDKINQENGRPRLFKVIEVNVFPDGGVDAPDDLLNDSEIVVASLHYQSTDKLGETTAESTVDRWTKAIERYPQINTLGHPLRDLPEEEWPKVDWDKLFSEAKRKNVAIELSIGKYAPEKLPPEFFSALKRNDNLVVVGPDFHNLSEYLIDGKDLSGEQKALLARYFELKSQIGDITFKSEDAIIKSNRYSKEEIEAKLLEFRKLKDELETIEGSRELAEIYSALMATEPEHVQVKNQDQNITERKIDGKPLPFSMLMHNARRIYQIRDYIDPDKIVNLWDEEKFSGWIESRKNNEQK